MSTEEKIQRLERDLRYVQKAGNRRIEEIKEMQKTLDHAKGVIKDLVEKVLDTLLTMDLLLRWAT